MPIEKPNAGEAEYRTLTDAIEHHTPACHGDDRFTADRVDLSNADEATMNEICCDCPLLAKCRAYAVQAAPAAGYWAGRYWHRASRSEAL